MNYLFYDENNRVTLTYFVEPPAELMKNPHFQVEDIPDPEEKEGFYSVLKCDGAKIWYEYKEIPPKPEDETDKLKKELEEMKKHLLETQGALAELFEKSLGAGA